MAYERYASAHKRRSGPGDQRTTALQIIEDEHLQGAWNCKVVLVTGTSSGIAIPTIEALLATGAKVFAAARNLDKARAALSHIASDQARIEYLQVDLNSLTSVRHAAQVFLAKESKLNVLINIAGIMAVPTLILTEDGFESQWATNHLGHFLLFQLLKPALIAGSSELFHSRVINVTSLAHRFHEPDFDDLESKHSYTPHKAYSVSKTANIWIANEIERRYGADGVHGYSVHPGGIASGLQVHTRDELDGLLADPENVKMMKSAEQGAATSIWAATAACWEGKGGKYLEDCQVSKPMEMGVVAYSAASGHAAWIYEEEKASKLWDVSNGMVNFEE